MTNPNLPRPGGRYAKDPGNHVTGCYGATPLEPMPPCIVYSTTAKTPERMRGKPKWAEHLPAAVGVWGLGDVYEMDTHVAVRPKGSYEEDLFIRTCLFYKSLYLNLAPRFKFIGDKVSEGPVFAKCDSGPGRNCKSARAIKFRRDMHRLGFYIGVSLPNATSMSQELDDMYQEFKGGTNLKADQIFARKTHDRAKFIANMTKEEAAKVPPAYLNNDDIPEMINGRPADPPGSERPFNDSFTPENIFKSYLAIGFCPFTCNALKHHKVRHELGDGGASEAMEKELSTVSKRYRRLKLSVSAQGLNGNVFDAELPVRKKHPIHQKTEDEQVGQLVKAKGAFSAGAQWYTFGFQLLGSRALIRAQVKQVEAESKGKEHALAKKKEEAQTRIQKAQEALTIWTATGKLSASQWKDILKFVLTRWEPKAPLSKYASMAKAKTKIEEFAAKFNKPWKELIAEEVTKATSELDSTVTGVNATALEWDDLHLDEDSDAESLVAQDDAAEAEPIVSEQAEC